MSISLTVDGKCEGCPCLSLVDSKLYSEGKVSCLAVGCGNQELCDRLEARLSKQTQAPPPAGNSNGIAFKSVVIRLLALAGEPVSRLDGISDGEWLEREAYRAISKLEGYVCYSRAISALPDCNTCLGKQSGCEYLPRFGEYCRINCMFYKPKPEEGASG